jgi:hypothetical protein
LSENLGRLGQQVGQQLAMREYQKQAAEALPAMQQAYAQAFQKMNDQDVAGAYQDIMNAQFTFGSLGNPMVDTMNKMAAESAAKAADGVYKKQLYGMQYGTSSSGLPAVDASAYGFRDTESNYYEPTVVTNPNQIITDAELISPANQPTQGTPEQRSQQAAAQREMLDQQAEANLPQPGAQPQATPAQLAGRRNFQDVTSLPVNEQRNAAMSYGVTQYNPEQYEVVKIAGLEKYLPEFEGFAVPKESWKETSASRSGKGDVSVQTKFTAPEARENFTKRSSNPKERGTKQNVEAAIESMKDKEMVKLFNDFDKDIYALRASTGSQPDKNNQPLFTVTGKDGNKVKITEDQYIAIQIISGIAPATSEDAGGTPAIFRPKKKTQDQLIDQAFMELGPNATDEQIAQRVKQLSN